MIKFKRASEKEISTEQAEKAFNSTEARSVQAGAHMYGMSFVKAIVDEQTVTIGDNYYLEVRKYSDKGQQCPEETKKVLVHFFGVQVDEEAPQMAYEYSEESVNWKAIGPSIDKGALNIKIVDVDNDGDDDIIVKMISSGSAYYFTLLQEQDEGVKETV